MDDALAGLRGVLSPPDRAVAVEKRFGLGPNRLKPKQWEAINAAIGRWRERVLTSAKDLPRRAFEEGHGQTTRFLRLLGSLEDGAAPAPDRAMGEWLEWLLTHELTGTLDRYADDIRSAVLYGLEAETNPTNVAGALYRATQAADRDWRLVAQTEMARANAMGRLAGCRDMGYDEVWIPPHTGSCDTCKRLIENKVFPAQLLQENATANYGRKQREWVPALPQHPRCRHTAVPYVPELYHEAQSDYAAMQDAGLDDATIDELFDSSGQLRPQHADDPRLREYLGKTGGPYEQVLAGAVQKVRRLGHVSKGFFDPPQAGLDPLIWDDEQLRPDVRQAILDFWTGILGAGWETWGTVYITGSAASYSWGTGWQHPWLGSSQTQVYPDVDTHLVIDYDAVRAAKPLWAGMSPLELRALLESWVKKAKTDAEVAPGMRLDAFVRTETTQGEFEHDIANTGQGVYDVNHQQWLQPPQEVRAGRVYGERILAGLGGRIAAENPDWITAADDVSAELQRRLDAYQATPTPEALAALQTYMDALYEARTAGFLEGAGQEDRGNWVWQYLENFGPLLDVKELLAG